MQGLKLYWILTYWKIYLTLSRDVLWIRNKLTMYFCIALIPLVPFIGVERYKAFTSRLAEKSVGRIEKHDKKSEEKYTELAERAEKYINEVKAKNKLDK